MYPKKLKKFLQRFREENKKQSGVRKLKAYYKDIVLEIFNVTNFLSENSKLVERLYCVENDIFEKPICPICKETNLKFGLSFKEGYNKYCSRKCSAICKEKKERIDITCKEKNIYQKRAILSSETMKKEDSNGISGHEKRISKTHKTKSMKDKNGNSIYKNSSLLAAKTMKNIGIDGKSTYERTGHKNHSEQLIHKGMVKTGYAIPYEEKSEYELYRKEVTYWSKKHIKIIKETWDGYDYYDNEFIGDNWNLDYNDSNYPTVDHKYSILRGYLDNISAEKIGSIENLCITKRQINISKKDKCEGEIE